MGTRGPYEKGSIKKKNVVLLCYEIAGPSGGSSEIGVSEGKGRERGRRKDCAMLSSNGEGGRLCSYTDESLECVLGDWGEKGEEGGGGPRHL